MARYQVNFNGYKKRQSYEELIDYLQHGQENIQYPNRKALKLINSPYLAFLDGEGVVEMEKQQSKMMHEQEKDRAITRASMASGESYRHIATQTEMERPTVYYDIGDDPDDDTMGAAIAETGTHTVARPHAATHAASGMLGSVETSRRHQIGAPATGGSSSSSTSLTREIAGAVGSVAADASLRVLRVPGRGAYHVGLFGAQAIISGVGRLADHDNSSSSSAAAAPSNTAPRPKAKAKAFSKPPSVVSSSSLSPAREMPSSIATSRAVSLVSSRAPSAVSVASSAEPIRGRTKRRTQAEIAIADGIRYVERGGGTLATTGRGHRGRGS